MGRTAVVTKVLLVLAFLVVGAVRVAYIYCRNPEQMRLPETRPAKTFTADEAFRRDMAAKEGLFGTRAGYNDIVARNLLTFKRFAAWAPLSGRQAWEGTAEAPPPATAFVAPGYPVLLAAVYKFAGPTAANPTSFLWLFLVQSVIGALGCVFAFYLARRVFKSTFAGWLALLATGISYFLVRAVAQVDPAVLTATMITASVLTIVSAGDSGSFWRHVLAGLVAGLTVLVAPMYLIVLPFAYLWTLAYGKASAGKRFGLSLVCILFFALAVAPWTYRNYNVFGRIVPIESSVGYHLWLGNNQAATGTEETDTDTAVETAAFGSLPADAKERLAQTANEVDRDCLLAKQAWEWMRHSDRAVGLRLRTWAFFWTGRYPWVDRLMNVPERGALALAIVLLTLVLAVLGIAAGKTERQRGLAWMIYLVLILYPLVYAFSHVTTQALYRVALDPLLLVLAAYAVAAFFTGGRIGRERELPPEEEQEQDLLQPGIPMARMG
jgi:4-amino-4-deoxy-L-arabinose transferase-like glycosyltransferase